jgi:hypothetical protein
MTTRDLFDAGAPHSPAGFADWGEALSDLSDQTDEALAALPEIATSDPGKVPWSTDDGVTTLDVDNLATLDDVTGGFAPLVARLTADSDPVNDSTTLVDVPGLSAAVEANAVYHVRLILFHSALATADLTVAWSVPAGVAGRWAPGGQDVSVAYVNISKLWTETNTLGGQGTGSNYSSADMFGLLVVGGTAGTLQFRFAQAVAEASNVTIRAQSTLIVQRIA